MKKDELKVIFVVQGYAKMREDGQLFDIVTLEVFAKSEKEAIDKAKKYVSRPLYRVSQVIEK